MLDIIALIFLTKEIGKLAVQKGLKPRAWKLYTVLAWFAGEFAGVVAGVLIFTPDNLFSILMVGIAGAVTGFLLLRSSLIKKPDAIDDIDQIGNNG